MDTSLAIALVSLAATVVTGVIAYIKINQGAHVSDGEIIRNNLVSKTEWLEQIDELKAENLAIQNRYELKIDALIKGYEEKIRMRDIERDKDKQQISDLKEEVRDLRHRLANVEQTSSVKQELKDKVQ